jgi:hypothetical protein
MIYFPPLHLTAFLKINETAISRFALQQCLLQANAADVLGDLQQRQHLAAQQQQQQQQHQRLGALHQQQLIQQHLQQQQSPTRLTHSLSSLLEHPSRLGLPASQLVRISGLSPFFGQQRQPRGSASTSTQLAPHGQPDTTSACSQQPRCRSPERIASIGFAWEYWV